jgi:hypothetical protein
MFNIKILYENEKTDHVNNWEYLSGSYIDNKMQKREINNANKLENYSVKKSKNNNTINSRIRKNSMPQNHTDSNYQHNENTTMHANKNNELCVDKRSNHHHMNENNFTQKNKYNFMQKNKNKIIQKNKYNERPRSSNTSTRIGTNNENVMTCFNLHTNHDKKNLVYKTNLNKIPDRDYNDPNTIFKNDDFENDDNYQDNKKQNKTHIHRKKIRTNVNNCIECNNEQNEKN